MIPPTPPADESDAPDGTAVFPLIPPELGIRPLTLAMLHAYVFLEGTEETLLHPGAAEEAMQYIVTYLQRLEGAEFSRVQEEFATLVGFAKSEKWPKQQIRFLQDFLSENGVGAEREPLTD